MTVLEALGIALAGLAAGTINTVIGSGTLITFPALLAVGLPPVTANVTNTLGLVPGSVLGAWGYRRELRGQGARALRFGAASVTGGLLGAMLLLTLGEGAFTVIVPVLIVAACVLVVLQPRIARRMAAREERAGATRPLHGGPLLLLGIAAAGTYGGYFGAAQGVILLGMIGASVPEGIQRVNALKNVLAGLVNAVAAAVFIVVAEVDLARCRSGRRRGGPRRPARGTCGAAAEPHGDARARGRRRRPRHRAAGAVRPGGRCERAPRRRGERRRRPAAA